MKRTIFIALAAMLLIAPGCTKRTKLAPEQMTLKQLEQEHHKYSTRGIALTTIAPVPLILGLDIITLSSLFLLRQADPYGIGIAYIGAVTLGGGLYMLGQGIHDLAKAKKIRRMQMKKAAQQRKFERDAEFHSIQENEDDKLISNITSEEILENDHNKHANRGIALTALSPFPLSAGGLSLFYAATNSSFPGVVALSSIVAAINLGGGLYMLGQGIHDLAKAKKIRRMQMRQAAQQRKAERETQSLQVAH